MERISLKNHYGEEVWATGIYDGPPHGKKKAHCTDIETGLAKNEECVSDVKKSKEQPALLKPIMKVDEQSCIKNLRGANGFEDIAEDHINLQTNLSHNGIQKGDEVVIHGKVIKYDGGKYAIRPDSWDKTDE